jgi:PAS domain S-box-containing protein
MARKPTYEELEQRVKELEKEAIERTHVEEALPESEERYRLLFEQSPIGVGLASPDGKVISANKAMEAITGYTIEELKEINLVDIYENPEDRKALLEAVNRDGGVVNFPVRLKRKDATPYDALLTLSRVHRPGGEDLFQTICVDITKQKQAERALKRAHNELECRVEERTAELRKTNKELQAEIIEHKRAEEALRESEERFREMADLLPTIIGEIDLDSRLTYTNRAGFDTFGYSQADLEAGLNVTDMLHPDDREKALKNIKGLIQGKKTGANEYRMFRKDGSELTVLIHGSPVYKSGKTIGIRSTFTDITQIKRTEKTLRESEEKYRTLFENANDAIFIADTDTHIILDANRQAEQLMGRPREEIIGMHQSELHTPHDAPLYKGKFREHVKKGSVFDLEAEVITKDGGIVPVFISSGVISIHGKEVIQGLFTDISKEKMIIALREKIAAMKLIEKAKGVLMDLHNITEKEAIRRLQRESRRQRKKTKEIAQCVVSSDLILD